MAMSPILKKNQKQFPNEILDNTIDDCKKSITTIDTVMECLLELDNLLLKNLIWKKEYKEKKGLINYKV